MQEEGIGLIEIIQKIKLIISSLLKKKLLILSVVLFGVTLGILYSIISKPVYKSSLSFVIEGDSAAGGLAGLASSFGIGGIGSNKQGVFNSENILQLLESRTLITNTLLQPLKSNKKKSFADLYIKIKKVKLKKPNKDPKIITIKPNTNPKKLSNDQNEILEIIHTSLTLKELSIEIKNPKNSIITIDVSSTNEEFARYFPEELIKIVSEYYIQTKTKKAKNNYEVIKLQTDSVRQELNKAISGVAAATDNTFLLNPAFNVKRVPSAQKEVNVQANTAILAELVKNLEMSRMTLLNETPIFQIIDTPISPIQPKSIGIIKGGIIGGFLFGFLIVGYLVFINFWRTLMNSKITIEKSED
jgi:uncharacterized protein involved in exopolysaccharide biosynthesis